MPENLKEIDQSAFENCESLLKIIIPEKLNMNDIQINKNAFSGCDLENINIIFLDNELDKEDMTNSISDTKKDENDLEL